MGYHDDDLESLAPSDSVSCVPEGGFRSRHRSSRHPEWTWAAEKPSTRTPRRSEVVYAEKYVAAVPVHSSSKTYTSSPYTQHKRSSSSSQTYAVQNQHGNYLPSPPYEARSTRLASQPRVTVTTIPSTPTSSSHSHRSGSSSQRSGSSSSLYRIFSPDRDAPTLRTSRTTAPPVSNSRFHEDYYGTHRGRTSSATSSGGRRASSAGARDSSSRDRRVAYGTAGGSSGGGRYRTVESYVPSAPRSAPAGGRYGDDRYGVYEVRAPSRGRRESFDYTATGQGGARVSGHHSGSGSSGRGWRW
ncbi:hypothetical protein M406DRAFT_108742 [Cryphonectria parasitica EP155]|uniref:Uncharacterized protein n=1 Tax=Cryphonectria parasitica (strain ATCC 38755 / EP155) TaxID=660469 RepID=A0A9P5CL34_CRYP1|nr:uncharacterized protein M406DRAFT_108742 [Cryphonectria parasitica EP155]KAF3761405.1 hypothetical protein M406DRAFT_108742 [Cryphonectria parasitica EP155]